MTSQTFGAADCAVHGPNRPVCGPPGKPNLELNVLLVDDERLSRLIVAGLLRQCNYKVTTAENGAQALELLRSSSPGTFHLVLTDVCMPDINGIQLLREVKQDDSLHSVPVIMMSSLEEQGTVYECVQSGAEEYLVKPVTRKDVQHVWQHVLRKQVAAATTVPQAALDEGPRAAPAPAASAAAVRPSGSGAAEAEAAGPELRPPAVTQQEQRHLAGPIEEQHAGPSESVEQQQQQQQQEVLLRGYGVLPMSLEQRVREQKQQQQQAVTAAHAGLAGPDPPTGTATDTGGLAQAALAPSVDAQSATASPAVAAPAVRDAKAGMVVPDFPAAAQFLRLVRADKWEQAAALRAQLAALDEDYSAALAAARASRSGTGQQLDASKRRRMGCGLGEAAAAAAPPSAMALARQGRQLLAPTRQQQEVEQVEGRLREQRLVQLLPELDSIFFQRRQAAGTSGQAAAGVGAPGNSSGGAPGTGTGPSRAAVKRSASALAAPRLQHLDQFSRQLDLVARTRSLTLRAELRAGDMASPMDMACGVALNTDSSLLATVGVCRRIKLFDFPRALAATAGPGAEGAGPFPIQKQHQYPCAQLSSRSKLSSVAWNAYVTGHLVTGDYDGSVQLWDCSAQVEVGSYEEHARRVWSVDFSALDPSRFLSGSDDGTVRLWSMHTQASAAALRAPASVCSVQFSPTNSHLLAFGCADSRAYIYDLRNLSAPAGVATGPSRAVSYVRFTSSGRQLVGASTDNALCVWDAGALLGDGPTTPVACLGGHLNRRNFVGLAVSQQGLVACGSEDNSVYLYSTDLPFPLARHCFGGGGGEAGSSSAAFASAVCWAPSGRHCVAANSQGLLQVLAVG